MSTQIIDQSITQPIEKVTIQSTDQSTDQAVDQIDQAIEKVTIQSTDQPIEKVTDETVDQSTDEITDQSTDQTTDPTEQSERGNGNSRQDTKGHQGHQGNKGKQSYPSTDYENMSEHFDMGEKDIHAKMCDLLDKQIKFDIDNNQACVRTPSDIFHLPKFPNISSKYVLIAKHNGMKGSSAMWMTSHPANKRQKYFILIHMNSFRARNIGVVDGRVSELRAQHRVAIEHLEMAQRNFNETRQKIIPYDGFDRRMLDPSIAGDVMMYDEMLKKYGCDVQHWTDKVSSRRNEMIDVAYYHAIDIISSSDGEFGHRAPTVSRDFRLVFSKMRNLAGCDNIPLNNEALAFMRRGQEGAQRGDGSA